MRGRLAQVVGVGLEREAQQGDRLSRSLPEMMLELGHHAALLQVVDLQHRVSSWKW